MPREYLDDPVDRYILDEEGDCTEITFLMTGAWAVAFNSFDIRQPDESFDDADKAGEETRGTVDMMRRGIQVASKRHGSGYFGDYYIFAGKRSQFYYCALSRCTAFALSKDFIYNRLFALFPSLHSDMLATSFARYLREFRKPCEMVRKKMIDHLN
jgi:hypothetical protein